MMPIIYGSRQWLTKKNQLEHTNDLDNKANTSPRNSCQVKKKFRSPTRSIKLQLRNENVFSRAMVD